MCGNILFAKPGILKPPASSGIWLHVNAWLSAIHPMGAGMKRWKVIVLAAWIFVIHAGSAGGTAVSLYSESGLLPEQNRLRVRIFADITGINDGGSLISVGFSLNYGGGLTNPVAENNVIDWYFGSPVGLHTQIEPDTSQSGKITFLLGKLDEDDPSQGISGYRIFLGSILFDYTGDPPTAGDIELADGHLGSFADFVTNQGNVLDDGVSYTVAGIQSEDSLQLRGVIRSLQMLSGMVTAEPARVASDDVTGDGRIGIEEPIYLLNAIAQ